MPVASEKKVPAVVSLQEEEKTQSTDLIQKIEESIAWSKKVFEGQERLRRYLFWNTVGNFLRLALVLIPIIIGLLFLPSLLRDASTMFQSGGLSNPFTEILNLYQS